MDHGLHRILAAVFRLLMEWTASWVSCLHKVDQKCFQSGFDIWERHGLHLIPNHFYQPIPDTRNLSPDLWEKPSEMVGVEMNEEGQKSLLALFQSKYRSEMEQFPRDSPSDPGTYHVRNTSFESVDGEILYCMIREFQPRRLVEVGSGFSTLLIRQALARNREGAGQDCDVTVIDPFPGPQVRGIPLGVSRWIERPVESVPWSEFASLESRDILFLDSSHVLRIGGDVCCEFLEILPRLNPGVLVHVHDVFLPAEYLKLWILDKHYFWTEQYMLQAFLQFNSAFEVLWGSSFMHLRHPDLLEAAIPSYSRDRSWPASFWMRKRS